MNLMGPKELKQIESVSMSGAGWETIVELLAVEYEVHRDLVLNPESRDREDIEFSRGRLERLESQINVIQMCVGFQWFTPTNPIWIHNR